MDFPVSDGEANHCVQTIALLGKHRAEAVLVAKGYDGDTIVALGAL